MNECQYRNEPVIKRLARSKSTRAPTCVDSGSQLQPLVRHVRDAHLPDSGHQVQCHLGDLIGVAVTVPLGQTAHHHVGVADRLHLEANEGQEELRI